MISMVYYSLITGSGAPVFSSVRTSHGTGTVVETDGEKYLVALDGQVAQLWEKEWGLKKA